MGFAKRIASASVYVTMQRSVALIAIAGCSAPSRQPATVVPGHAIASASELPAAAPAAEGFGKDPRGAAAAVRDGEGRQVAWPRSVEGSDADLRAKVDRLRQDGAIVRTNWTPPGKADRYGHAEGIVFSSAERVKARLADYAKYKELAGPRFKKVTVVDKSASTTDVYFQLPIMKGIVTIWYVTRFESPFRLPDGGEVIEGRFVKGNIKDMQIVFTVRPASDSPATTVMACDIDLVLPVAAPQELLDEELRDACGDAINAIRKSTEGESQR